jgi:hypothetical protein
MNTVIDGTFLFLRLTQREAYDSAIQQTAAGGHLVTWQDYDAVYGLHSVAGYVVPDDDPDPDPEPRRAA